jgi:putative flippase GtrA
MLRLFHFVLVGTLAALTHLGVVYLCVQFGHLAPLAANLIGWLVAFCVSFSGHFFVTFAQFSASIGQAARRFFLVSLLGFGINEIAYALALSWSKQHYLIILVVVLVFVAALTYVLSLRWAFFSGKASD